MSEPAKWWEYLEPLFKEEDENFCVRKYYARKTMKGWQYALVTTTEDGKFVSVLSLYQGKIKLITEEPKYA